MEIRLPASSVRLFSDLRVCILAHSKSSVKVFVTQCLIAVPVGKGGDLEETGLYLK